jgi:hypothetical protein
MEISPDEAKEALDAIQRVMQKTRRSFSSSGAYIFMLIWGSVWMVGFLGSQFLPSEIAGNLWIALDILGGILSAFVGIRMNRGVRSSTSSNTGKRIAIFWLLLFIYCSLALWIVWPVDGKQLAMFIIIFITIGWLAMGLLLSFVSVWWALALTGVALVGYIFLPDIFYLWMAILGGGGMIALGLYIRARW